MTTAELSDKINQVLVKFPSAKYDVANEGVVYIFSDGVTKPVADADIKIDVLRGDMWLKEGTTL